MVEKYNSGFSFKLQTKSVPYNKHAILKNLSPRQVRSNLKNPIQNNLYKCCSTKKYSNNLEKEVQKKLKCLKAGGAKAHRAHPDSDLISNHTKTLLCVRCKGSLTVEAAMVLPLFVFCLVLFLGLFHVLLVEVQINQALSYTVSELALDSATDGSFEELLVERIVGRKLLLEKLDLQGFVDTYIENGKSGIVLSNSLSDEEYVRMSVSYSVRLPVNVFGKRSIDVEQSAIARRWIGRNETDVTTTKWVYITPFGTVCHKSSDCPYLDLSIWAVQNARVSELRNKDGGKYHKCGSCASLKSEQISDTVYITDYGVLYHCSLECSSLKRTVIRVEWENVKERALCRKCS